MHFFKKFTKILLGFIFVCALFTGISSLSVYADEDTLYLGGFPAGFILNTQEVEVIGMCDINTENGPCCPARESGIKSGDKITKINDKEIKSAQDLTEAITDSNLSYKFTVMRGGEGLDMDVYPIKDKTSGKMRVGLLVKDNLNGIGTVTYIDKAHGKFGSLGHPVTDEKGNLIKINGGTLFGCSIYDVKKGVRGNPGELKGFFDNSKRLGSVVTNSKCGIFGKLADDFSVSNLRKVKRGSAADATMGKAHIYSTLDGNKCEEYEISIVKVDSSNKDNRNYVIKINDKRLLEKAGGIVQGMSGSPIVQNGKLIGAVTHVFVNDPTRGYGIALENMTGSY